MPRSPSRSRNFRRGLRRAVDQADRGPDGASDDTLDQRIVRAAEYERVDTGAPKRREIILRNESQRLVLQHSFLDERNEQRARLRGDDGGIVDVMERALVRARPNRAESADDTDASRRGCADRGTRAGLDDAGNRELEPVAQRLDRVRGRRVAGDDDVLYALVFEKGRDLDRVTDDGLRALRTVRNASGVAEVDDVLVRQAGA